MVGVCRIVLMPMAKRLDARSTGRRRRLKLPNVLCPLHCFYFYLVYIKCLLVLFSFFFFLLKFRTKEIDERCIEIILIGTAYAFRKRHKLIYEKKNRSFFKKY